MNSEQRDNSYLKLLSVRLILKRQSSRLSFSSSSNLTFFPIQNRLGFKFLQRKKMYLQKDCHSVLLKTFLHYSFKVESDPFIAEETV